MPVEVGVALWSMQSTATSPASWPRLYADLVRDARHAEALGFDSLWIAEHRFWYDGWCPAPLVAAAAALGATRRLYVGTAMHLLPQHDPTRTVRAGAVLDATSRGRFRLGVGLGYRDEEFDGVGLARAHRGRRMEAALDVLRTAQVGSGDGSARPPDHPSVWVGGMARAAIARAARRGLGLLLPPTLRPVEVREALAFARSEAHAAGLPLGRVGMVKDLWVTDSETERREHLDAVAAHYREYAGSWYRLHGEQGFARPDLLDRQMARTRDTAVVGRAGRVVETLGELADAGVDMLALHVSADITRHRYATMMSTLAETVLPALRDATQDDHSWQRRADALRSRAACRRR